MRKVKASELSGSALDWAVAKCAGEQLTSARLSYLIKVHGQDKCIRTVIGGRYSPSTDWAQGGPIIERELIGLAVELDFTRQAWIATIWPDYSKPCTATATGPTPLIAAMRCYVASKLGDEVEVPEELA